MTVMPPNDFVSICSSLQNFRGDITGMLSNVDGRVRDVVSKLLEIWDENFIKMQSAYPAAIERMEQQKAAGNQQRDEIKAKIAEVKAKIAQAEQKQEEKKKKKAEPTIPPLKPIDLTLGVSLRDELLERFGAPQNAVEPSGDQSFREIWEGWEFEPWDQK